MAGISNLKRVQAIIRERTSNNKLITILSFLFAFIILLFIIIVVVIKHDFSSCICLSRRL